MTIPVVECVANYSEARRPQVVEAIIEAIKSVPKIVVLDRHSPALHLVQRIRDEAHRFAITYHRSLRDKKMTRSVLDEAGISSKVKKLLLERFTSIDGIREATVEELTGVPGIGGKTAEKIYRFFH